MYITANVKSHYTSTVEGYNTNNRISLDTKLSIWQVTGNTSTLRLMHTSSQVSHINHSLRRFTSSIDISVYNDISKLKKY